MITVLPCKVKLLHFPRSHLPHVTHAIVKSCFFKAIDDHYFFSFTENAFEISIIASQQVIDLDFVPPLIQAGCETMRYSSEAYCVLQVDDEGGQDASGKRISDISWPLAQNKFSIFYMSTYQTDFVLIKKRRLLQAIELLKSLDYAFDLDWLKEAEGEGGGDSPVTVSVQLEELLRHEDYEKFVLTDELQCVGLNPHLRSEWAMTVLKILSYPEFIPSQHRFFSYTASQQGISLLANQTLLDQFGEETIFQEQDSPRYHVIQVNLAGSNLDSCGIVWSISHLLTRHMNLLYLSTYNSANVLVSSEDVKKAKWILSV
ncbi:hypothetical protein BY458DRAFT_514756 [Sporodiniella umbellata]|nr:hypothetical protein BY458DRAFT_514756 [Sporodiniella umbellata]